MPIHDIFPKTTLITSRRKKFFGQLFRVPGLSRRTKFYGAVALGLALTVYFGVLLAPSDFTKGSVISIKQGMTLSDVAAALEKENIVRSTVLFKSAIVLLNGDGKVLSGDYFFNSRPTFVGVAWRVARGIFGFAAEKITIPEGANVYEVAALVRQKIPKFDTDEFIRIAKDDEGYLFPDTYHFLPGVSAGEVHRTMHDTFDEKMKPLNDAVKKSGKNLHEIVTMASLLEEEARHTETRRLIAGILWRRLDINMPLQVDATFSYINGKNTFELTLADLRDGSSLYNTYTHKGLPPGPISNPGLDSIVAALYPKESPYLFYLADLSGVTHYSRTFEEHKEKKFQYLP